MSETGEFPANIDQQWRCADLGQGAEVIAKGVFVGASY